MTYRRRHRSTAATALLAALLVLGQAGAGGIAASAGPLDASGGWAPDLSTIDADDVNVAYREGALRLADPSLTAARRQAVVEGIPVLAEHRLSEPARRLRADVAADAGRGTVEIDARGARTNGWSDWHRVPADGIVFERVASRVQVRIRLAVPTSLDRPTGDAGQPHVTAVTLTAAP